MLCWASWLVDMMERKKWGAQKVRKKEGESTKRYCPFALLFTCFGATFHRDWLNSWVTGLMNGLSHHVTITSNFCDITSRLLRIRSHTALNFDKNFEVFAPQDNWKMIKRLKWFVARSRRWDVIPLLRSQAPPNIASKREKIFVSIPLRSIQQVVSNRKIGIYWTFHGDECEYIVKKWTRALLGIGEVNIFMLTPVFRLERILNDQFSIVVKRTWNSDASITNGEPLCIAVCWLNVPLKPVGMQHDHRKHAGSQKWPPYRTTRLALILASILRPGDNELLQLWHILGKFI